MHRIALVKKLTQAMSATSTPPPPKRQIEAGRQQADRGKEGGRGRKKTLSQQVDEPFPDREEQRRRADHRNKNLLKKLSQFLIATQARPQRKLPP